MMYLCNWSDLNECVSSSVARGERRPRPDHPGHRRLGRQQDADGRDVLPVCYGEIAELSVFIFQSESWWRQRASYCQPEKNIILCVIVYIILPYYTVSVCVCFTLTRRGRWTAAAGEQTSWWSMKEKGATWRTPPVLCSDQECRYDIKTSFVEKKVSLQQKTHSSPLFSGVFSRLCVWGRVQQHLRMCAHSRPLCQPAVLRVWR